MMGMLFLMNMSTLAVKPDSQQGVASYVTALVNKFSTEHAREHAYRPAFEDLIKVIDPLLQSINDPKKSEHGAPDFIFMRKQLIAGYAETKDVNINLDKVEKSEQLERYFGYSNLILTNYLEFRFFRNGERYGDPIVIAELQGNTIIPRPDRFSALADTLKDFLTGTPENIKSGSKLAKIMGGKARRIRDNVSFTLQNEPDRSQELKRVYDVIKELLVHDLELPDFADMYAQTLVYGLFVARFHDETPETFSRQEARDLVPASNPLLQHFFDHIVGPNFDKRLEYIVNELCEVFAHADVRSLMHQYFEKDSKGHEDLGPDPVIHFYEDFLKEYDSAQRKKLGAFYTPVPVVRFIVRSIDHILKSTFGLANGLADTSKIEVERDIQGKKRKEMVHQVQILDPAVGTGTFLNEIVQEIHKNFSGQEGRWRSYVDTDLLPRLHGFELMMAPYTIAHLKLGMTLRDTGYTAFSRRLGIYLTNSLEEGHLTGNDLFSFGLSQSIAEEAISASEIKNQTPIMVITGNPPYSVSSSNKGDWITNLIKDYKNGLEERNIQPLSDDYIKFIRYAEHFIERNGTGIVAMITNNSFLDGIIHRQMRKHVLETFDEIYVLDLHGNAKKKETSANGGKDENVFAIQQGVAICIFIKKKSKMNGLGKVFHMDLYGRRSEKFSFLNENKIDSIKWEKLKYTDPYYFFVKKDFSSEHDYNSGFKLTELFQKWSPGASTGKDDFLIKFSVNELKDLRNHLNNFSVQEVTQKYEIDEKKIINVKKDLNNVIQEYTPISYRPFDIRYTLYSSNSEGVFQRPRPETMKNFVGHNNIGFQVSRQQSTFGFQHVLVSNNIVDRNSISMQTREATYLLPLYIFDENGSKTPNLEKKIVNEIEKNVGKISPEDTFDYIYAVLHSPGYRKKYKEFLKIDFPRIPYPKNKQQFDALVAMGQELRELHLLKSSVLNKFITTYPEDGENAVEKIAYMDEKAFINSKQYFGNVPEIAWNFYIGGYQPAQKWLKDRKGRALSNEEIEHYQKMIVALVETDRIMKEIDKISLVD
ncbi:MAG: type ISP restriction/modification enzyme [bacterium]|nr:type ISP restriction/modification enzyme [bacterium]